MPIRVRRKRGEGRALGKGREEWLAAWRQSLRAPRIVEVRGRLRRFGRRWPPGTPSVPARFQTRPCRPLAACDSRRQRRQNSERKTSGASSRPMKPYPLELLNHFTRPVTLKPPLPNRGRQIRAWVRYFGGENSRQELPNAGECTKRAKAVNSEWREHFTPLSGPPPCRTPFSSP